MCISMVAYIRPRSFISVLSREANQELCKNAKQQSRDCPLGINPFPRLGIPLFAKGVLGQPVALHRIRGALASREQMDSRRDIARFLVKSELLSNHLLRFIKQRDQIHKSENVRD
jgi:hypothetical protein